MSKTNTTIKCSIDDCILPSKCKGFCPSHYERWRNGLPSRKARRAELDRVRSKTAKKKASNKAWFQRNPGRYKEYHREYHKKYVGRLSGQRREKVISNSLGTYGWIDKRLISNYYTKVCGICGLLIESKYEIDHITPIARNGTHALDNLQLTHPVCNRTKKDRLQKDMELDIMILREYLT